MIGEFIQASTAIGILIATVVTSEINFHFLLQERDQLKFNFDGRVSNVEGGQHYISMFIVEENGLPFSRTAITPQVVVVVKGKLPDYKCTTCM